MAKPSEETIKYLQPVVEWLKAGAPHETTNFGFNMQYFNSEDHPDYAENDCGTVCCIAGAVAQFNDISTTTKTDSWKACLEIGRKIGLDLNQTKDLFLPDDDNLNYGMSAITPTMALDVLNYFIATGDVVWSEKAYD